MSAFDELSTQMAFPFVMKCHCGEDADFACRWCHQHICFGCAIVHFTDDHHKEAKEKQEAQLKTYQENIQQFWSIQNQGTNVCKKEK